MHGGKGVCDNSEDCIKELELADNDCEMKRDEKGVDAKSPLLNNDEWGGSKSHVNEMDGLARIHTRYEMGVFGSGARGAMGMCLGVHCVQNR